MKTPEKAFGVVLAVAAAFLVAAAVSLAESPTVAERVIEDAPSEPESKPVEPKAGETRRFDGIGIEFVWIPPGTFLMGSPSSEAGRRANEGPVHEVTISKGFWMGKYEVTKAQWEAVMGTTPWAEEYSVFDAPDSPAVYISWNDAQAFVSALNDLTGMAYRLPTEAEWEYACRATGTKAFCGGDGDEVLDQYAWYRGNAWNTGANYARPVGQKKANEWGLHDMHGNAGEWCADWYSDTYYSVSPATDPTGPSSGSSRVWRGGRWFCFAFNLRSAVRFRGEPGNRIRDLGLRLCRPAVR
jgi:formylglycine-generating enzyme required for sulfatase activity